MKAALAKAKGYIAPNNFETELKQCTCGNVIAGWQSRCSDCVAAEVAAVVVPNSAKWLADEAASVLPQFTCPQCGERRADALIIGELDLVATDDEVICTSCGARYTLPAAKMAQVERILSETQGRHSRLSPVFFLDCSAQCYSGQ